MTAARLARPRVPKGGIMKRRGATVALTLTVLALWGVTFTVEAHAATGSISGTVTDAANHSGVAGIQVYCVSRRSGRSAPG